MCVMSMVIDHYQPLIPKPEDWWQRVYQAPALDVEALQKIIKDFQEAAKAAETVDRLTGQPDCVDPEKATLLERVRHLEKRLAQLEAIVGQVAK